MTCPGRFSLVRDNGYTRLLQRYRNQGRCERPLLTVQLFFDDSGLVASHSQHAAQFASESFGQMAVGLVVRKATQLSDWPSRGEMAGEAGKAAISRLRPDSHCSCL
jgi:hypothetical protein